MLIHESDGSWRCSRCDAEYYNHSDAVEHDEKCSAEQEETILGRLEQLENQVNFLKGGVMKPCEIPCPKCGSLDISRKFIKNTELFWVRPACPERFLAWSSELVKDMTPPALPGGKLLFRRFLALHDLFTHSCRVCAWYWETPFEDKLVESTKT